jgi:hypothetical protein
MRRTLYTDLRAIRAVNHTAISANGSTDGASIGLDQSGQDFKVAMFVLLAGTITDGTYTAVPQESANGSTGWTNIPADRLQGSGAAVDASGEVAEIGVVPDPSNSPFIRLRVTASAVTTGGAVQAVCLLGSPSGTPIVRS